MGLGRTFTIGAEHKDRSAMIDSAEAARIFQAIDDRYCGWEGTVAQNDIMLINDVNWYDYAEDMLAVSKEFPDILFTIHCEGMMLDDIWNACFCDGRWDIQYAFIPEINYRYVLTGENEA